ncbi:hypothetical protein CBR_g8279 [Chara braunii]|uniref:Uncharacterized protein n=1 Tax=Chara braunii TaxID=69332 RepID=A0A388KLQ2_CHABU|nr:hypothetical protein CBR_g8279 [Chara braunii]|eukprot:GBG70979.1 hypothetical protein CBR_g8279 [Chara braunii]
MGSEEAAANLPSSDDLSGNAVRCRGAAMAADVASASNDVSPSSKDMMPECPVCGDIYSDEENTPRMLPCGHTICQICVTKLPIQFSPSSGGRFIKCPECRSRVLWRGMQSLPKNYALIRLLGSEAHHHSEAVRCGEATGRRAKIVSVLGLLEILRACALALTMRCWTHLSFPRMLRRVKWLVQLTSVLCGSFVGLMIFLPLCFVYVMIGWWTAWLSCLVFWWLAVGVVGYSVGIAFVFLCVCWIELLSGRVFGIRFT